MGITCSIKSFHCVCQNVGIFYSSVCSTTHTVSSTTHTDFQAVRRASAFFFQDFTLLGPISELYADVNEVHGLYEFDF